MFLDAIPAGRNPPGEVNVLIEVPLSGEPVKCELDKNAGILVVDRFLYTPMRYPVVTIGSILVQAPWGGTESCHGYCCAFNFARLRVTIRFRRQRRPRLHLWRRSSRVP
jgi:hypothetical protein